MSVPDLAPDDDDDDSVYSPQNKTIYGKAKLGEIRIGEKR